jgi:hypothetical protein
VDGWPVSCAFCICWPGALFVVGDCANADEANNIVPATIKDFFNMRSLRIGGWAQSTFQELHTFR